MSKSLKIKIFGILVNLLPPVGVCIWQFPIIISRTDSTISFAAALVIILFMCFAKDSVKKHITSPSVFTVSVIFVILGYLGMTLGTQLLIIGSVTIVSSLAATPLYMWAKNEAEGTKSNALLDAIKGLVNKDEKSDEDN